MALEEGSYLPKWSHITFKMELLHLNRICRLLHGEENPLLFDIELTHAGAQGTAVKAEDFSRTVQR